MLLDGWVDQDNVGYILSGIQINCRENIKLGNFLFAAMCMDLGGIMLSENEWRMANTLRFNSYGKGKPKAMEWTNKTKAIP